MVIDVIVLIGMMDNRMKEFIKNHKFHDKIVVAYKICNIKHLTCDIDVIIPFGYLLENGLISNTYVHLYELLLTLNVKNIYYYNEFNIDKMKKITDEFNVKLIKTYSLI